LYIASELTGISPDGGHGWFELLLLALLALIVCVVCAKSWRRQRWSLRRPGVDDE
jgi:hypothetical protein